jgi:hypothetical protein
MATEHEALRWYVTGRPQPTPVAVVSCFWAALRDARNTTGRDEETGAVTSEGNTGTWLGAVGYLALLDQIGSAVTMRRTTRRLRGEPDIVRALREFSPSHLTRRDLDALYALRCSLAHDFSLFNEGQGARAREKDFHFGLHTDPKALLIEHAWRRWSVDYATPSEHNQTWVNLRALGDLAEGCAANVERAFRTGRLRARIPADDLLIRYSFSTGEAVPGPIGRRSVL